MLDFDKIPMHNNYYHAGKTLYFKGTDSKEQWIKHSKDPKINEHFIKNGWIDEHSITYSYNSHGFRDDEFTDEICFLALGCSFTEGTGLLVEQCWPKVLEKLLHVKIWNLGVSGCSLSTCFRLLLHYLEKLNIQSIFLLEPPDTRFEVLNNHEIITYSPMHTQNDDFYRLWINDDKNIYFYKLKNLLAIKKVCEDKKIKLFNLSFEELNVQNSLARDMIHHGLESHNHIAQKFMEQYRAS